MDRIINNHWMSASLQRFFVRMAVSIFACMLPHFALAVTNEESDVNSGGGWVSNSVYRSMTVMGDVVSGYDMANVARATYYPGWISEGALTAGSIGLSTGTLRFTAVYAGVAPSSQLLVITNTGQGAYTYTNHLAYGAGAVGWFTLEPPQGTVEAYGFMNSTGGVQTAGLNAGVYYATNMIVASDATNSPQTLDIVLTLAKADQAVTFPVIADQLTTATPGIQVSASSGLQVTCEVVSGSALITGFTNLTFTGDGPVVIRASQAGNSNYNAAAGLSNSFMVTKTVASVVLGDLSQIYSGSPRVVSATTVPTGLTVNITYEGSSTAPSNVAAYSVEGLVDDAMYQGRSTGTLVVAKGSQTISFPPIPPQNSTNVVGLSASSTSSGTVVFAVESGPGQVTGGTNLTFTNTGWVVVSAAQPGNTNWNAAASVTNGFEVVAIPGIENPAVSAITATSSVMGAEITTTNMMSVLERGVVWGTNSSVSLASGVRVYETGLFGVGVYTLSATGLPSASPLYFCGYAVNASGTNETGVLAYWTVPVAVDGLTETNVLERQFDAQWNGVYGATNYCLDVAYDAQFTNAVSGYAARNVELNTDFSVTGVTYGAACFWRVRAENEGGFSVWSVTNHIDLPQLQLDVLGTNQRSIADGSPASLAYGTDYGFVPTNRLWSRTFYLRNEGSYPMLMSNVTFSGAGASAFSVSNIPSVVAGGETAGFQMAFFPELIQTYSASVHIVTTAGDSRTFSLQGAGCNPPFTNVLTKVELTYIDWILLAGQGLLVGTLEICNEIGAEDRYTGPFHYAVREAPGEYRLVSPDGVDSEGRDYIDITTQVLEQTGPEGLSPGRCVTITNIQVYSYNLTIPQDMDEAVWATATSDTLAPEALAGSFRTKKNAVHAGQLYSQNPVEGSTVTYQLLTPATSGVTVVNADGSFTYTSTILGHDVFEFGVSTIYGTDHAAVQISVRDVPCLDWLPLLLGDESD